jgi:hypothetical protein
MRSLAVALLIVLAVAGFVAGAAAQTSTPSADTQAPASSSPSTSGSGSLSTPGGEVKGPVTIDRPNPQARPAPGTSRSGDDVSALPRAATERTTIFGLSPTAAVIIAAALLVVVILAIVAMTRSDDAYIDTDRRI